MRRFISVVLLLASLVMGLSCRQQEPRFPQLGVRPAAPRQQQPYESVPLAAFGPAVKALPESMGRCTEAPEYAAGGLRAVRLRIAGVSIGIREIAVAIDSSRAVRWYFEIRNDGEGSATLIRIDSRPGSEELTQRGVSTADAENRGPHGSEGTRGTPEALLSAQRLGPPAAVAARILEQCAAWVDPWGMLGWLPDSLAPPPVPRPEPRDPEGDRAWRGDTTLGDGYLTGPSPLTGVSWMRQLLLPIYREPGGRLYGWLARGWLYVVGSPGRWRKLVVAGLLNTAYDGPASLRVFAIHSDGWFRFRYAAPSPGDDGTAWAHTSHLLLSPSDVRLVPWEYHYFHSTPTYIAEPGPHPLYASSDSTSSVLAELKEHEYGLSPLEVKDDWMKVRVQWPGPWCAERAVRTAEGWIRWRTPERGPRLAIYLIC